MKNIFIVFIYLVLKAFQLLNSYVLVLYLNNSGGIKIMAGMLICIFALLIFGVLLKKFLPPSSLKLAGLVLAIGVFIIAIINSNWALIFFAGILFYALIYIEGQILQSFANFRNIPRFGLLLISLIPISISYLIPDARTITPQLFYVISSIFAFIASYSARKYGGEKMTFRQKSSQKAASFLFGLLFIGGSWLLYYFRYDRVLNARPFTTLVLIILLYVLGAFMIYSSINNYLKEVDSN